MHPSAVVDIVAAAGGFVAAESAGHDLGDCVLTAGPNGSALRLNVRIPTPNWRTVHEASFVRKKSFKTA